MKRMGGEDVWRRWEECFVVVALKSASHFHLKHMQLSVKRNVRAREFSRSRPGFQLHPRL
jgi:hypothetical protein